MGWTLELSQVASLLQASVSPYVKWSLPHRAVARIELICIECLERASQIISIYDFALLMMNYASGHRMSTDTPGALVQKSHKRQMRWHSGNHPSS